MTQAGKIQVDDETRLYGTRWQRFLRAVLRLRWCVEVPGECCIRVRPGGAMFIKGCHFKRDGSVEIGNGITVPGGIYVPLTQDAAGAGL